MTTEVAKNKTPVPETHTITITVPKGIHKGLSDLADADDRTLAVFLSRHVKRFFEGNSFDGQAAKP